MFAGTGRRIISIWFQRLPSERALRKRDLKGPFALAIRHGNSESIHCLNPAAEKMGLHVGMAASQARALCRNLTLAPADSAGDLRFLENLRRWSQRFAPWVVREGNDGLALDITGTPHLWGGEEELLADMRAQITRMGLVPRLGLADTRGGAWALAHFAPGIAPPNETLAAITSLPVAALRLEPQTVIALQRVGLRSVGDLTGAARAPLARRFGQQLLNRLDQASGAQPEPLSFQKEPPHFVVRLTLPEPIGLLDDVTAAFKRLLDALCAKLLAHMSGARMLELSLRRVDHEQLILPIRFAAPLRDPARILPLFTRQLEKVDAGFGIDQLRLAATIIELLPMQQIGKVTINPIEDLITRIGTRIGLENIYRFAPQDSHWPEHTYALHSAADTPPCGQWPERRMRPILIFPPESINGTGSTPPSKFRWRRMDFTTAHAIGPERIAPEWWASEAPFRDYWRIITYQGRRLWLFHTPQKPCWYVQGEFA